MKITFSEMGVIEWRNTKIQQVSPQSAQMNAFKLTCTSVRPKVARFSSHFRTKFQQKTSLRYKLYENFIIGHFIILWPTNCLSWMRFQQGGIKKDGNGCLWFAFKNISEMRVVEKMSDRIWKLVCDKQRDLLWKWLKLKRFRTPYVEMNDL